MSKEHLPVGTCGQSRSALLPFCFVHTTTSNLHLERKALKLTQGRIISRTRSINSNHSRDRVKQIEKCIEEDDAVNGASKMARQSKRTNNRHCAQYRQPRTDSPRDADRIELFSSEPHIRGMCPPQRSTGSGPGPGSRDVCIHA